MSRNRTVGACTAARALQLLMLVTLAWTAEASAHTYVILSLVGDHLTIVTQRRTGSRMDVNEYEVVPVSDSALDDFATRVADATIAKARPDAGAITLRAGDPALYKVRDSWLDADVGGVADLVAAVKKQLPPMPDAHLMLITPYRDQPQLKTTKAELGGGKVSGLGFYVDTTTWLYRTDTHEKSRGFLGIFANFQLVLINLQSSAVEGHERVVLGATRSSARAEDRTPWNALTAAQETQVLQSLMKEGIEGSLPRMLGSQKP